MADKKTSQTQQNPNTADAASAGHAIPAMNIPGTEAWAKMVDAQMSRYDELWTQMVELERRHIEQSTKAIDEIARLSKESLAYGMKLSEQWHEHVTRTGREFQRMVR